MLDSRRGFLIRVSPGRNSANHALQFGFGGVFGVVFGDGFGGSFGGSFGDVFGGVFGGGFGKTDQTKSIFRRGFTKHGTKN